MTETKKKRVSPKQAAIAASAAMLAIAYPFYTMWEGTKLAAYKDIVGVVTICSGDTRNVHMGMVLTEEECRERTNKILNEFGAAVAAASPGIENSPYEWAAHTSFAANIGKAGYARGSVPRLFREGKRVEACRFMRRYKFAGGREVRGLIFRREGEGNRIGEYELCIAGAVPEQLND